MRISGAVATGAMALCLFGGWSATAAAQEIIAHGDWPPSTFCNVAFPVKLDAKGNPVKQLIPWSCNDKTSALTVPFGMSVKMCENDGEGPSGLGRCRQYLPGVFYVGDDMNDVGTSFFVDNRMVGYLNSADFPTDWLVGVAGTVDLSSGKGSTGLQLSSSGREVSESYSIDLPASCRSPRVVELTKANDASWGAHVEGQKLKLSLRVRYRHLAGPNNWVGVEIVCK